jgi:nucleosome assembly protein 1-like 1
LSDLITDRDSAALKHLVDVRLEYVKDEDTPTTPGRPGFKILFEFSPNDFFGNKILDKTYLYSAEVGYSGDFVYDCAIGTKIQWKEDKDLTKEFEIKKQRNKSALFFETLFILLLLLKKLFQIPIVLASFVRLARRNLSSTVSS